ncbi:hypothetical protein ASPZODRAFT_158581 [Penicilliopsis zonata CBS 506.65]|uniref:Uncharacterized protein n=1 Tax=Penicilliopsis zonata CBS 506.65 TaxID=1073090 RepID=A0A1L9SKC3_9EURO|nr:hypothetical protein ASPZODRAFT_158581 [Penicilliopsis zonata CBS 506.65]OJJ47658.1 hypothetical protein ASPZODRAFT_158581 [Penicilliopsis zonata CBS 506.65]
MSDVEAVSSLPAALDAGPSAFAATVNARTRLRPPFAQPTTTPLPQKQEDVSEYAADDDGTASPKADSEAETIIQSGRESLSPEKRRKFIRHEPKRRDEGPGLADGDGDLPAIRPQARKRTDSNADASRPTSPVRRARSPLPLVLKRERSEEPQVLTKQKQSSHPPAETGPRNEKERISRKRSFSESVNGDSSPRRNPPKSLSVAPRDRDRRDVNNLAFARPASHDRSLSPARPSHKRTASGPLLSTGDIVRKRKVPQSLITSHQPRQSSEDRQSVSSSASSSPLPSAHFRKLASVDGSSASPAKQMGKKQRDQNGRTRLARACAARELEAAMARHAERPGDLNVADNAGNTPLQIASLEGCAPIVQFLLDAGCDVDTKNIDRDTPLIDAVENGHLDVVKLLLDAGANPRILNAEGDELCDLVPSDSEDYDEIRRVIEEAMANPKPSRRRSEEQVGGNGVRESGRRASAISPRESPPVPGAKSPPVYNAATSRRKTVRSEVTRNDLLWTKPSPETLREFASKGDIAGVATILNVGQPADAEAVIAAAKGGHDEVMSLLFGIGDADPDPEPLEGNNHKPGWNTPMLAAIGRGNLLVIKLLLDQPNFDPTRRFQKRTYYEISRDRKGENWEEEAEILEDAYEAFSKTKKTRKSDLSSPRRARHDKESKRHVRRESHSPVARQKKPPGRQPSNNNNHEEPVSRDAALTKEKRREPTTQSKEKTNLTNSHDHSIATSDPDTARGEPTRPKPILKVRRDSESSGVARADEVPKRRRLIAGRPPQDRDRRQPSLFSSDSLSGREEVAKSRLHTHPDTSAPKSTGPSLKRIRNNSASPERSRSRGSETERRTLDANKKKRRVFSEDRTSAAINGTVKDADESKVVPPVSHIVQLKQESSVEKQNGVHKQTDEASVKVERDKVESHALDDIPMAEVQDEDSQARERKQVEAKKAEDARSAEVAEQKLAAAEKERARVAKEDADKAARAAREKAEEEDRKRKEADQRRIKQAEDERQKRLEQERLRAAKLRKEQEEQEQRRRDALPSKLCLAANLVGSNDPLARSHAWLQKFMPVVTALTKQLDPACEPDVADERWVPNYLVAPLLATNDLQLSQYPSWEKREATQTQRMNLWRVTRRVLVQADESEFHNSSFGEIMQKDCEARRKYLDMKTVFWVKLSDFMDLVPHVPHLNGLEIQFLRMHIDPEPSNGTSASAIEIPKVNGHAFDRSLEDGFSTGTNGLVNGYSHPVPGAYV